MGGCVRAIAGHQGIRSDSYAVIEGEAEGRIETIADIEAKVSHGTIHRARVIMSGPNVKDFN
jgi:hypothetical protein